MIKKIIPLLVLLLLSGCAITHKFGPYQGQIVDKETGKPISGAVVFMRFFTYAVWNPGGAVNSDADAIEVLTDEQGRFEINHRVFAFRPGSAWEKNPAIIIFKPSYGVFPRHPETTCKQCNGQLFPPKEDVTIEMPKLTSRKDRLRNIGYASYDFSSIKPDKQEHIFSLIDEESVSLGLQPRRKK